MKRVLIAGRPNVGKSSLFNKLVRKRKSLVVNRPGMTRDILKQKTSWWGHEFEVWDSGGWKSGDAYLGQGIDKKVQQAVKEVDCILLVMDAKAGLRHEDKEFFRVIKKSRKPFLVLVNKVDQEKSKEFLLNEFYELGSDFKACAFESDKGLSGAVEWVIAQKHSSFKKIKESKTRILVVGKTNSGKSSLCNALLKKERMLVSSRAGTTTDIVEEVFSYNKEHYTLVDTAGLKPHKKTNTAQNKNSESLAMFKTEQSFKQASLIFLILSAVSGPGRKEAKILKLCQEEHKAVMAVVSKWDLSKKQNLNRAEFRKKIQEQFVFYPDLPVIFTSALHSTGLTQLLKKSEEIQKKLKTRISTSELNRFFSHVIRKAPSPVYGVDNVKFYYLTQTRAVPPVFIAFANYPAGVSSAYKRFLIRQIQNKWGLKGVPIKILVRPKN